VIGFAHPPWKQQRRERKRRGKGEMKRGKGGEEGKETRKRVSPRPPHHLHS
jgi:hypothetical protein